MERIKVSEKFYSIQGEGMYVGVPSVFLRTFGCNFSCAGFGMPDGEKSTQADGIAKRISEFKTLEELPLVTTGCDSYTAWHPKFKHLSPVVEVGELACQLLALTPEGAWECKNGNDIHLVITGGEPLLGWQRTYPKLLSHPFMSGLKNVTFETNGTQPLSEELKEFVIETNSSITFTFSVSAKLSASGEARDDAIKPDVVVEYETYGPTYLKFVVSTEAHFDEVRNAVAEYRAAGFIGPVYVMPVGGVEKVYNDNQFSVAKAAMAEGWRYSPRLHLSLFGNAWAT